MLNESNKKMLASWGRSFGAAALALYMTGNTDPSDIGKAALAAVLPVLMRWANPSDPAFGRSKGGK